MASEFYVVEHHGAWRIRVDGIHRGQYPSREAAVRAAVMEAQAAGPEARVLSTGISVQYRVEWRSGDEPHPLA
jgi:hypothetical protein